MNSGTELEKYDGGEIEVTPPSQLSYSEKTEIEAQVEIAKRFPRNITVALENATKMATLTHEIAAKCEYALPRKKEGKTVFIKGKSIRLAEIMAANWNNLRYGSKIIGESEDGKTVKAIGFCWDTERNIQVMFEVSRGIYSKKFGKYSADMINMTAMAASAIALRNAILKIIPMAYAEVVATEARKVAAGSQASFAVNIASALAEYEKHGIDSDAVLKMLEKQSLTELDLHDLSNLHGVLTALETGEIKPAAIISGEYSQDEKSLLDQVKEQAKKKRGKKAGK